MSRGRLHSQVASALFGALLGISCGAGPGRAAPVVRGAPPFTSSTPASTDPVAPGGSGGSGGGATGGHEPLPCKNANGGGGASADVGASGGAGMTLLGGSSATDNVGGAGGNGATGGADCPREIDAEIYDRFTIGKPVYLKVSAVDSRGGANGPPDTFSWSAINERCHSRGGTFSDTTNLPGTTFTCDEEGLVTLTLHIGLANTLCDSVYTHPVQCVP